MDKNKEYTGTEPPIEFETELAGEKGARFTLKPTKKHTKTQVYNAMVWLRVNRDVVKINIEYENN